MFHNAIYEWWQSEKKEKTKGATFIKRLLIFPNDHPNKSWAVWLMKGYLFLNLNCIISFLKNLNFVVLGLLKVELYLNIQSKLNWPWMATGRRLGQWPNKSICFYSSFLNDGYHADLIRRIYLKYSNIML